MKLRLLLVVFIASVFVLPGIAQEDTTVLTVNGESVSAEEFAERTRFEHTLITQLAQFRFQAIQQQAAQFGVDPTQLAQQDQQFQQWIAELQSETVLGERVLDTMANELILQQYADANDIEVTEEDVTNTRQQFFGYNPETAPAEEEELYNEFVDMFRQRFSEAGANPELLDDFFRQQALASAVREDVTGEQSEFLFADVSHILVDDQEEAEAIIALLEDGEDFAQLAMERSLDPGSGAQGGALGEVPVLQFVGPFAEAVRNAETGEIVGPVETQFGYHIIRVDSKETRTVEGDTLNQLRAGAFRSWIAEQTEAADIGIEEDWQQYIDVPEPAPAAEATPEVTLEPMPEVEVTIEVTPEDEATPEMEVTEEAGNDG